jgi:hypothetical protein
MKRLAVVLSLLSLTACRFNPPGQCQIVADCQPGERCASSGLCLTGCDTDLDCDEWERCTGRNGECVPLDGSCNRESDCEYWENCTKDHFCEVAGDSCVADTDCTEWQFCSDVGICLLAGGRCTTSADCVGPMSACNEDHQCVTQTGTGTGTSGSGSTFGAGKILLFGTLGGGNFAISAVESPSSPKVGFEDYITTSYINPDGKVVYLDDESDRHDRLVRVFTEDSTATGYPLNPLSNDEVLPTPACYDDVVAFVMNPSSGKILYSCKSRYSYFDQDGNEVANGASVWSWNGSGHMLLGGANFRVLPSGSSTPVEVKNGPDPRYAAAVRTDGNGFLVAEGTDDPYKLWQIDNQAKATVVKTYGGAPSGWNVYGGCRLDKSRNLYCKAANEKHSAVVKFTGEGVTGQVVYSEANAPADPTGKYVMFCYGTRLITGP